MRLGGIYLSVGAKTNKLKRDLAKAKGITKKAAVLMQQEIGRIDFKHVGIAAAAFGVTVAVGMKKAIDAASDLQEVQGKFDVVFSKNSKQAEDMASILVDAYAMSERESKQYLSSVQDLLVPMGMMSDAAALMSNEVVKLAADLGSFNNLPTSQVMLDIQSALVGNFETMKKYGVILNETVIKQEALNQGLWDGKGMVDANTKAQIAFKLMLRGSAAAIGDMERTSESYANQMKLLGAQIEDIAAAIGDELLPEVTEWVSQKNKAIKQNPQIIKQVGELSKNILELATNMGKVIGLGVEFANVWVNSFQAMGLASGGVISWKTALTDAHGAMKKFETQLGVAELRVQKHKDKLKELSGPLRFFILPNVRKRIIAETETKLKQAELTVEYIKKEIEAAKALNELKPTVQPILAPPPAPTPAPTASPSTPISQDQIKEFQSVKEDFFAEWEEFYERQLEMEREFNQAYSDLGKTQFDIERDRIQAQADVWREYNIDKVQIAEWTSQKLDEINKAETQARFDVLREQSGMMADNFKDIAEMGGKYSKETFAAYKAFKIAETIIATRDAAMKAYSSLAGIPYVGPALGAAAAGAAIAFGSAQVATIQASQPPSYDVGGISNARGVYQTGNIQEAHVPIPSGKIPVEMGEQPAPQVNVDIVNVPSPDLMEAYLATPRGKNSILNVISSDAGKYRRVLGSA